MTFAISVSKSSDAQRGNEKESFRSPQDSGSENQKAKRMRGVHYGKSSLKIFENEKSACRNGYKSMESGMGVAKTITTIAPCFPNGDLEMLDAPSRSSSMESLNDSAICLLGKRVRSMDKNSNPDRCIAKTFK